MLAGGPEGEQDRNKDDDDYYDEARWKGRRSMDEFAGGSRVLVRETPHG